MKAIVYEEYGPPAVLQLKEVEKPIPKENDILVKIYARPVNYGDLLARNFKNISRHQFNMPLPLLLVTRLYFGVTKPRINILGSEFAGEIETVGKDVTRFQPGDQVCGYLGQRMGAYAEYLCMPETGCVAQKPVNMTYAEAATVPYGGVMALSLLRNVNIHPGHRVLINGASGGIGSHAVQLAKYFGADVTGVCSTPRVEFVKVLGADTVIDYTHEDFTQNGEQYECIFDILGKSSFARCKHSLTPNGRYLLASFKMKQLMQMLWTKMVGSQKVICALASEKAEDLIFLKELIEAGRLTAIIDRQYPLEQAAEAHRYIEQGQKKGHIVLTAKTSAD